MSGIVVGIDGSHNATHALEWAMTEASIRQAPLTVITVNSVPASYWTGAPVELPGDQDRVAEIRKTAEAAVAETAAKLGTERPESVTVTAISGFPAQTLIDASNVADMLVVGTRGGGGFAPLVLGSVSSQVVHHAHCPVVVVPSYKSRK
jgi:nucleotide-binding universal stress UspA family protein